MCQRAVKSSKMYSRWDRIALGISKKLSFYQSNGETKRLKQAFRDLPGRILRY
jgi:hypothetical protein